MEGVMNIKWQPKVVVIGDNPSIMDEMCVASLLYPEEFISYDTETMRRVRNLTAWHILKMMDKIPSA
jgi:hypothetical protein